MKDRAARRSGIVHTTTETQFYDFVLLRNKKSDVRGSRPYGATEPHAPKKITAIFLLPATSLWRLFFYENLKQIFRGSGGADTE